MEAEKAGYPIALMARVLGVTRAGFYAWGLVVLVGGRGRQVVGSWIGWWRGSLLVSNQAYGAGRITVALRRSGARVGVKAVAASMRRQGLSAASPSALPA